MVAKETSKAMSREEVKKSKKAKKQSKSDEQQQSQKKVRIRLVPIWLRVVLVLLLMVAATVAGLVVGYGVIGSGNPEDTLNQSTWQHILDLVEKK
ncbi:DNA-directed RNA polymerase subunit beta [Metabacillus sp. HB246100]